MNDQPKALQFAERLAGMEASRNDQYEAAAELRRLYAENERLREALLAEREACAKADTQGSCIACGNRITHPVPQQVKATAQKGGDKLSPTSKAMRTCKYCNGAYTANAFTTRTGFTCKWCAEAIRARGEQEQPR